MIDRSSKAKLAGHLAIILGLSLFAAVRYWSIITWPTPHADERVYLRAFEDLAEDRSPYYPAGDDLDYFYPPAFANVGGIALKATNTTIMLAAMRAANLVGLGICLWYSGLFLPLSWVWRCSIAALYILIGPISIYTGLGPGNLSLAAVGSSLAALAAWSMIPKTSGVLFGLSGILKPMAPVGILALGAHRPRSGGTSHLWTAGIAMAIGAVLTLVSPFLSEYLALNPGEVDEWPLRRSVSLYRWVRIMGFNGSPIALVALVSVVTLWFARRRPISKRQLSILAIVAMTFGTPALWAHTLLIALPLQVMALVRAWQRTRADDAAAAYQARYEVALVVLAVLSLQMVRGIGGGVEVSRAWIQLPVLFVPVFAPLALGMYCWREDA
jgi:hypothetical protein